ncbi:DUF4959 domain-containing protein [Butyricimonas virosa]|uniref:DUF4959 domain-containing protein n=1 Tax=Butyricimonas virosa TaxID=544645 RepID=UPI0024300767|nr:DUF4959 domain-containing protein [Butyricimonas virosa]
MKFTLFLFILLLALFACQDDDKVFDIEVPNDFVRAEAVPGGAMVYYNLPAKSDVFAINFRYKDCRGNDVLKVGDYGSDSLLLDGFNEHQTGVPVFVSLVNRQNLESDPFHLMIDTKDSAPYSFFDKADVSSSWGGFQLIYDTPEQVSGMVHIFYLGTNPHTQQIDTILMKSSPIVKGGDTLLFALQQDRAVNTVVVRTEDHRGFRVKQQIWEDVEAYFSEKLDTSNLKFIDVHNLSVENDEDKSGIKYLFDGDTKGEQRLKSGKGELVHTFLAGPGATGKPFIIDMKKERVPAKIRFYNILNNNMLRVKGLQYQTGLPQSPLGGIWLSHYEDKIPCEVTVYGGHSDDPKGEWTKIGSFSEDRTTSQNERWAARCTSVSYSYETLTALQEADPAYIEIIFPAFPITYRYIKFVVEEVFLQPYYNQNPVDYNPSKYVTIHELEVYTKKD